MDYKELARLYRSYAARFENGEQLLLGGEIRLQDALREAATAIETLLSERDAAQKEAMELQVLWDMYGGDEGITVAFQKAVERDAAVEDLRGDCKTCAYFDKLNLHEKCVHCKYVCGLSKPQAAWFDNWQWRGPQKGENNDQAKL